jgi:hypothetical protein
MSDGVDDIDGAFVPAVRATVSWVDVDGEALAVNEVDGRLALLNPTATLLLECFDGSGTIEDLVSDLARVVEVPTGELLSHVVDAARRFGAIGYLEDVEPELPDQALDDFHRRILEGLADGSLVARRDGDGLDVDPDTPDDRGHPHGS